MFKKIIAVVLILVLAVGLTACSGGTKNSTKKKEKEQEEKKEQQEQNEQQEPKKKRQPSGFRCYKTEDPSDPKNRILLEEYEDLVTEATLKEYNDDSDDEDSDNELAEITRWYYDDEGEILLKEVNWHANSRFVTYAVEYDRAGRTIRYSEKQEHEYAEDQDRPGIPFDYREFISSDDYYNFSVGDDVKELVTEYTYKGDTDKLAGLKSVTDTGNVVAVVELGDGDIILSKRFQQDTWRLEETYNPDTRTGTWNHYTWSITYDDDYFENGWDWVVDMYGTKEYDESGRILRSATYRPEEYIGDDDIKVRMCLSEETVYSYGSDGMVSTTRDFDRSGICSSEKKETHDPEGRVLQSVSKGFDEGGILAYERESTYTYHENGERASEFARERYSYESDWHISADYEYDENGDMTAWRTYDNEGQLRDELTVTKPEVPGISGEVRCRKSVYYDEESEYKISERYEVHMKMPDVGDASMYVPYGDGWFVYRIVVTDWNDKTTEDDLDASFDSEGRLRKVYIFDSGTKFAEFDEQGRVVHCFESAWSSDWEYFYEYWEDEAADSTVK